MKRSVQIILSGILLFGILLFTGLSFSGYASEKLLASYADKIPGIGLICESVSFDGITISHFRFMNEKNKEAKYIFVKPGQEFNAHMQYYIDADKLKTLHLHHLIIGLHEDGPQKCVLHSLGIKNSAGDASVTLKAPEKEGAYQVRFCHSEGLTDEGAKEAWWKGEGPSAKTIVGIVVVKK